MPDFTRTDEGLANYCLFYGVDLVVFVEGGENRTPEEAVSDIKEQPAVDTIFWGMIFKKFGLEKSFYIKPLGGKENIKPIAKRIDKINNIICALDRDYEILQDQEITHDRVIYTYGYSWENDIYQKEQVIGYLPVLLMVQKLSQDREKACKAHYDALSDDLPKIAEYCYISFLHGRDFTDKIIYSLFDNKSLKIKKERLDEEAKKLPDVSPENLPKLRHGLDINGKILAHFGFLLIKKYYGKFVDKQVLNSNLITFCQTLDNAGFCSERTHYYQRKINVFND